MCILLKCEKIVSVKQLYAIESVYNYFKISINGLYTYYFFASRSFIKIVNLAQNKAANIISGIAIIN